MNKTMYPMVPQLPGAPDAPPSYNQTYTPMQTASAPTLGFGEMVPPASQQQQQPQTIFVQSPAPVPPLGPRPCLVICPCCHQQQISNVRYETATKTHLFAALICVLGLFCCACIPYCIDTCKNPNHYCSNCDAYLGTYNNK